MIDLYAPPDLFPVGSDRQLDGELIHSTKENRKSV
jgi:hypothetical protein